MEILAIHPENTDQLEAIKAVLKAMKIPFSKIDEKDSIYDPEFVKKIKRSIKQKEKGEVKRIDTADLWK